jgi:NitT/TauT family transport system substrate-binding protein
MVAAGLYRPGDVDPEVIAATQFVNRRVGMDIKDRLSGPSLR